MKHTMSSGPSSFSAPGVDDVEEFSRLFKAHLAQTQTGNGQFNAPAQGAGPISATDDLEAFRARIPSAQQPHLDAIAQNLRLEFHAEQTKHRQARLQGLLKQTPPFRLSQADLRQRKTSKARAKRHNEVRAFINTYARRDNVGVHPFFAALRQVLAAQALDWKGRRLQWVLDDAVLMECGGDDFMQAAVWTLKGILAFDERTLASSNPFLDVEELRDDNTGQIRLAHHEPAMRVWTVGPHLGNLECRTLASLVPANVVASRSGGRRKTFATLQATRRGALVRTDELAQLYAIVDDEEVQRQNEIPLSTGMLRVPARVSMNNHRSTEAQLVRDGDYKGNWIEWIISNISLIFRR